MTTQEFISNTYGVASNRDRHCSSVFTDHDGNVYSYGYHYPLLFNVAGRWFINTRGYSTTTGKHIGWARQACSGATPVELNRDDSQTISSSWASDTDKLKALARATAQMVADATVARDKKVRKDTQVYEQLTRVLDNAIESAVTVATLIREA